VAVLYWLGTEAAPQAAGSFYLLGFMRSAPTPTRQRTALDRRLLMIAQVFEMLRASGHAFVRLDEAAGAFEARG